MNEKDKEIMGVHLNKLEYDASEWNWRNITVKWRIGLHVCVRERERERERESDQDKTNKIFVSISNHWKTEIIKEQKLFCLYDFSLYDLGAFDVYKEVEDSGQRTVANMMGSDFFLSLKERSKWKPDWL